MTKSDILNLIGTEEIDTAMKAVLKATNSSNEVILINARWNGLKKDRNSGTISTENADLFKNRIINSLLSVAQGLPDDIVVEGIEIPAVNHGNSAPTSNSNPKVFISYNHKDKEVAHRLKEFFTSNNVSVTIDSEVMKAG